MIRFKTLTTSLAALLLLFLAGCGGADEQSAPSASTDPKYDYEYEGLILYAANMPAESYTLKPLSDSEFNALGESEKRAVADKLLATLYFGMPADELEALIETGAFVTAVQTMISEERNDLAQAEARLDDSGDEGEFSYSDYPSGAAEISRILARFYVLDELDRHYIDYWSAYVLSQSILFSPAYELASSHAPNVARVYGRLVRNFRDETSAKYATFLHMISDDNWRRFRSPEDNGREMMEIYLLDFDDAHVPVAGKALKNWKLDRDNDTLVIGLNENSEPLELFGTTIVNGFDFYRELAKSGDFFKGVTGRLVDIYFPTFTSDEKQTIVTSIVASHPKTWQDILLQIVFSKAYLLGSDKPKSAEELFYAVSKKIHFKHRRGFFNNFAGKLAAMNQASMKYKLGKYTEVPLDTQSFATYHKFIREEVLMRNKTEWSSGWEAEAFIPDELFGGITPYEHRLILDTLTDHIFQTLLSRKATEEEKTLFSSHMIQEDGTYNRDFELFRTDNKLDERIRAAIVMMDYISRLSQTYRFEKVQ
jgi:hypothetical protein